MKFVRLKKNVTPGKNRLWYQLVSESEILNIEDINVTPWKDHLSIFPDKSLSFNRSLFRNK